MDGKADFEAGLARLGLELNFTAMTVKLYRNPSNQLAMKVFTYSITYITLLFGAMALDQFVRNA